MAHIRTPKTAISIGKPLDEQQPLEELRHTDHQIKIKRSRIELEIPPESSFDSLTLSNSRDVEKGITAVGSLPSSLTGSLAKNEVENELVLSGKKGIHGVRWVRHRVFSLYRRFFSIVWIANLVPIIVLVSNYRTRHTISLQDLETAMAANITVAVLMRQPYVINMLFNIACAVPTSAPLAIRRQCARVYHIGGVHSGCAAMATVWFTAFVVTATRYYAMGESPETISLAALVLSYIIVLLLLSILVMSYPTVRVKYHDHFELVHRFSGWTALALLWVQIVLTTDSLRGDVALGIALVRSAGFWLLIATTISIALPWVQLRKVKVRSERLSDHAIRVYFDYTNTVPGTAVRLSERPLLEWHAFAAINEPDKKGFSSLISNAGDWTKRQIEGCPSTMWVRGIPTCGLLRIVPLFRSIVLVATGSGIGPCLSVIMAKRVPCRIFWSTPHPEKTFGDEIVKAVHDMDPRAVIHNTRTMGRPDMVAISYRLYKETGAEAVCVISNKKLTDKVVYAMESRGIPAYGAIFDS